MCTEWLLAFAVALLIGRIWTPKPMPESDDFAEELSGDTEQTPMQERLADAATVTGWTMFGLSFAHIHEVLQCIALIGATACSLAAAWYYIRKS